MAVKQGVLCKSLLVAVRGEAGITPEILNQYFLVAVSQLLAKHPARQMGICKDSCPKDHVNIRSLQSGRGTRTRWDSRNHAL